jgi:hypothetical protein
MPKKNNKVYTQEEFEADIAELESLINNGNLEGGANTVPMEETGNDYSGQMGGYEDDENNEEDENYENNNEEDYDDTKQYGGKSEYKGSYRHFKLDSVNGKPVTFESKANITENQTPLNAAKKLLRSYCRSKGLKESDRLKLNITFTIRETTRGHSKIFGPYTGKYQKYTAEELKKSKASGITFKMKPIVKLAKK